jgi:ComF family protein
MHFIMHLNQTTLSSFLKKTSEWVLPHACILCQTPCQDRDICEPCAKELPYCKTSCPRCGLSLADGVPGQCCGQCLKHPPPFHHTIALFEYKTPLDQLITRLKFHEKLVYARVLGEMMADSLAQYYQKMAGQPFLTHFSAPEGREYRTYSSQQMAGQSFSLEAELRPEELASHALRGQVTSPNQSLPNCIIPIPLHKTRLQERGFNQAVELGRPIAKKLGIPLVLHACKRSHLTQAQSSLPSKERRQNLKGAFSLTGKTLGKHIAILDDVMTTASTVTELSQLLNKAGVEEITVWCIARSSRD